MRRRFGYFHDDNTVSVKSGDNPRARRHDSRLKLTWQFNKDIEFVPINPQEGTEPSSLLPPPQDVQDCLDVLSSVRMYVGSATAR